MFEESSENMHPESIPPLTDEWLAEIHRRSDEFDAGNVETTPWEVVRRGALRRLATNVGCEEDTPG